MERQREAVVTTATAEEVDRRRGASIGVVAAVALVVGVVGFGLGWMVASTTAEDAASARHDQSAAVVEEIVAILDDPAAFGSEEQVAAALAGHAAQGAMMEDEALGTIDYQTGFYETLYDGAVDAEIDVHHVVVADDGSTSVVLWNWHGDNIRGNRFELTGISVITHDDEGRVAHELVTYPYPESYVLEAASGGGTP